MSKRLIWGIGRSLGKACIVGGGLGFRGAKRRGGWVWGGNGYMGPPSSRTDEFNLEESRNSEHEYLRRAFEECYARFGLEVMMEWRDGMPVTRLKLPDKNGLKDGGKWVDIRGGGYSIPAAIAQLAWTPGSPSGNVNKK
ncbi:hypothetical protein M7I_4636 [Glarea lozoyensis 74030]|uniref:Uncharacterized protein n=1 Tax=Glarea lozoyensis (strain ATCC 74030 / MF5533) TaxID=1104152 RepID=H0EPQ1_GLAL7|nr:hypothetical protein M7I_4636 [Glarea lozoyensis 74030]